MPSVVSYAAVLGAFSHRESYMERVEKGHEQVDEGQFAYGAVQPLGWA